MSDNHLVAGVIVRGEPEVPGISCPQNFLTAGIFATGIVKIRKRIKL
jgi:hypothetical protein